MPVFDFIAIGRFVVRYAIFVGIILFVAGLVTMVYNGLNSALSLFNDSLAGLQSLTTQGGSSNALSCFYYVVSGLGLDVFFTSFLSAFVGMYTLWAGLVIASIIARYTFVFKNLLLKAVS